MPFLLTILNLLKKVWNCRENQKSIILLFVYSPYFWWENIIRYKKGLYYYWNISNFRWLVISEGHPLFSFLYIFNRPWIIDQAQARPDILQPRLNLLMPTLGRPGRFRPVRRTRSAHCRIPDILLTTVRGSSTVPCLHSSRVSATRTPAASLLYFTPNVYISSCSCQLFVFTRHASRLTCCASDISKCLVI